MLGKYLKAHPEIRKAGQARLEYLLQRVEDRDSLLEQALDEGVGPDVLMAALQKGIVKSRVPVKAEDEEVGGNKEENKPESVPATHPGQRTGPPKVEKPQGPIPGSKPGGFFGKFKLPKISIPNPFRNKAKDQPGKEEKDVDESKERVPFGKKLRNFFTGKWLKIGGGIVLGIIILVFVTSYFGAVPEGISPEGISPEVQTPLPAFSPPSIPQTLRPVDLANASWFSPVQIMIILSVLLVGFANYRDAKQRGQVDDFMSTVWGVVKIVSAGLVATLLKGPLSGKYADYPQLLFWVSLVLFVWAFEQVYRASKQGGTDYTPVADLLVTVAGWGLIFGTLGAVQYVFSIPKAPVLPLYQVQTFFVLKHYDKIWMSLAVYTLLAAGVFIYGEEVVRLTSKMTDAKDIAGTISTSFVGLVAYPLVRIFAGWTPIQAFLAALACAMLTGLVAVRVGITTPVTTGEGRIPSGVVIPWDKLAFQLATGLLVITLLGRV